MRRPTSLTLCSLSRSSCAWTAAASSIATACAALRAQVGVSARARHIRARGRAPGTLNEQLVTLVRIFELCLLLCQLRFQLQRAHHVTANARARNAIAHALAPQHPPCSAAARAPARNNRVRSSERCQRCNPHLLRVLVLALECAQLVGRSRRVCARPSQRCATPSRHRGSGVGGLMGRSPARRQCTRCCMQRLLCSATRRCSLVSRSIFDFSTALRLHCCTCSSCCACIFACTSLMLLWLRFRAVASTVRGE